MDDNYVEVVLEFSIIVKVLWYCIGKIEGRIALKKINDEILNNIVNLSVQSYF